MTPIEGVYCVNRCQRSKNRGSVYTVQWELLREKTFMNFAVLWLFEKVLSAKFGSVVSFGTAKVSNPRKFSLQKS